MLMVCRRCGTRFAVGLFRCPNCTAEDAYEEGSGEDMAKISGHGGPSNNPADLAAAAEESEGSEARAGASDAESAPPVVVGGEAPAPDPGEDNRFDPATHTAPEVLAYLDGAGPAEARRVLDAERDGKARKGILDQADAILARESALYGEAEAEVEEPEGE